MEYINKPGHAVNVGDGAKCDQATNYGKQPFSHTTWS